MYPFSAIVGQQEMKLALLMNVIDPLIGGVIIRGAKGTAKSTAVRGLVRLLPEMTSALCPFRCDPADATALCADCMEKLGTGEGLETVRERAPLVTFPLNATEDRILGGLDLEHALRHGARSYQPGLLARANRGILYIDEVNLLDDQMVDLILSVAASGINLVEREGISFWHPAQFILVGTMNPEEGELRSHFMDRFGLCVVITGENEAERRVEIVERRQAFDRDPSGFAALWQEEEAELAERILRAKEVLPEVILSGELRRTISQLCTHYQVAGHRADLILRRAAAALAAFEGRTEVTVEDIERVAVMALCHRRRRPVPEPPPTTSDAGKLDQHQDGPAEMTEAEPGEAEQPDSASAGQAPSLRFPTLPTVGGDEQLYGIGETFPVREIDQGKDRLIRKGPGRRSKTRATGRGRHVRSISGGKRRDVAFDATVRAAAPHQQHRRRPAGLEIAIREQDIHSKIRERKIANLLLFIVDASSSMGVEARMEAVKGAIFSLLMDAYQKRDQVAMVTFRDQGAVINLRPTSSVDLAVKLLTQMPVGGHTPLSHGMVQGFRLLRAHLLRRPTSRPIVILITDGRANVSIDPHVYAHQEALDIARRMGEEKRARYVVVDTEAGDMYFGLAAELARCLGAEHLEMHDLKARDLVQIVTKERS